MVLHNQLFLLPSENMANSVGMIDQVQLLATNVAREWVAWRLERYTFQPAPIGTQPIQIKEQFLVDFFIQVNLLSEAIGWLNARAEAD